MSSFCVAADSDTLPVARWFSKAVTPKLKGTRFEGTALVLRDFASPTSRTIRRLRNYRRGANPNDTGLQMAMRTL